MDTALSRAQAALVASGADALIVGISADLAALTSYHPHASERMTAAIVAKEGPAHLVLPILEEELAKPVFSGPMHLWSEGDKPGDLVAAALRELGVGPDATIAASDQLWTVFLLEIQEAVQRNIGQATWISGHDVMAMARMVKNTDEVGQLREVGAAIDRVHSRMSELLIVGETEHQCATRISAAMIEEGHQSAAFVIVGSGPNGASPHHEASDRVIEAGDPIVVDIGGPRNGWYSDCTRNYMMGSVPEGYDEPYAVLQAAQRAAVEAVRPGATASEIDLTARQAITDGGYGEYFIHRTGHGIGLDVHEAPYITEHNTDQVLEPGMAFSVEPGIYLPGKFGMRIEDIVTVTDDGVERLNKTSTDYVIL